MKLHSASHIMEYFLLKVFGDLPRYGSNVNNKKDRSDYKCQERLNQDKLKKVEELCNKFISQNHNIQMSESEENENIRVWMCADIKMFCGGTHVKNTQEIGRIRLKRKNKGKGIERVESYLDQ